MSDQKIGPDVVGAAAIAVLLIVLATLISASAITVLIAPIVFALMVYCMMRVPLRISLLTLMLFGYSLEQPGDAESMWRGPFATFGAMMLSHINTVDRSLGFTSWMSFSGMDLCLVTLLLIAWQRRMSGSKIDRIGYLPAPKPLVQLAYLTYGGIVFTWISGLMRGGIFAMSLWQLDRVMYLPTIFLLCHLGLRGPKDLPAMAKVLLVGACYKALIATYVANTVTVEPDPLTGRAVIACATNHGDSILFACAFVLIIAMLLERVKGRTVLTSVIVLPLLSIGMISNNRRMAWVAVALVFVTVFILARETKVKRMIRRTLIGASPLIVLYIAIGWNSTAGIFKPAQMARSIIDPQTDGSTMWREYENFNIISTLQLHPILGSGYGNGYIEFFPMPEIPYELEHYAPHNSILGLWCYAGYFGFTAITMLWAGGFYFAIRAYHNAKEPSHRAGALVSFGAILIYMIQCWGDMGIGTWTGVFTVGPSLALAGKLLVASGDWTPQKKAAVGFVPQAQRASTSPSNNSKTSEAV